MTKGRPSNTIILPGTDDWVLAKDEDHTKACIQLGRLNWDGMMRDLLLKENLAGKVVLDIGAHIGDTTREFILQGCGEVFAFEAQPDAFACLEHNCPTARCFNVAVGNGQTMVRDGHDYGRLGCRWTGPATVRGGESVETMTIDSLNLSVVDFIKMDIEGAEPFALEGMAETIERCRPRLLIEFHQTALWHNRCTIDDILKHLRGYRREVAIGRRFEERWDEICYPA